MLESQSSSSPTSERSPRPFKNVFTIATRDRDGQKFWLKVGAAFPNRDGSLHVKLDAMPVNGELHIRDPRRPDEGRFTGGEHDSEAERST